MAHFLPMPSRKIAAQLALATRLTLAASLMLGGSAAAQTLTPGAAAIGGTTGNGGLIAPGGGTVTPSTSSTPPASSSGGRTKHYPSSNWILSNPPVRTQVRGAPIATFQGDANDLRGSGAGVSPPNPNPETDVAALTPEATPEPAPTPAEQPPEQPSELPDDGLSPVFVPPVTDPASDPVPEPVTQPDPVTQNTDTTTVTAGASDGNAPTQPTSNGLSSVAGVADFQMVDLDFGLSNTELTADHIFRMENVIALMRAQPTTPLSIVAVISQADGDNEDVKLLARKRILAVRRYILSKGLSSDALNFKITANAEVEPFANHVLIQR